MNMRNSMVYLSLGGNEGDVLSSLQQALTLLSLEKEIFLLKYSHFYRTAPIHTNSLCWFVNAVCSFQTSLSPNEVFKITQAIEKLLGKVPKPKNASRPIDIDILFYGDQTLQERELEIPHPRWKERLFVLIPLADLTKKILIRQLTNSKCYLLEDLIHPLLKQSTQEIYLLEKNPNLQ